MLIRDVLTLTQAQIFSPDSKSSLVEAVFDIDVQIGLSADLMSDVLLAESNRGLLVTGLINPQIIRTAEMSDIVAILLVRGKKPLTETCKLAQETGIPILGTKMSMFEACGRLHVAGLVSSFRQNS